MEREYNVPLRREWLKVPRYKRAKKAVTAMKQFLGKHMKSENIKLGGDVNEKIWGKGMRNPPHHVKVIASKDSEGIVTAKLADAPKEAKKEAKASAKEDKKEAPKEEKKAEVKTEAKPAEKAPEKPAEKKAEE